MGIYEDRQIHTTKTRFRPIKLQESQSGPHTNRTPYNNIEYHWHPKPIGESENEYQNEAKGTSNGPCHCMKTRRRVLSLF